MPTYRASFALSGFEAGSERVSFENPVGGGKKAIMHMPLRTVADQGFSVWIIRRRTAPAHHVGAQEAVAQKQDSASDSAACRVFYDDDGTQLVFNGSVNWERLTSHDASDGGDDSEEFVSKYLAEDKAFVVRPGESMTLSMPDGEIDYNVEILWEELQE
jgi:hypothetical protein